MMYALYSTRLHGWYTKTATYTSVFEDAARFSEALAFERIEAHYDVVGDQFGLVMVPVEPLETIRAALRK